MSEQTQQRKHQVIGAVVLVALGLIVVSILLRSPEQESSSLDYSIPKEPEVATVSDEPVVTEEELQAVEQNIEEQWPEPPKTEPTDTELQAENPAKAAETTTETSPSAAPAAATPEKETTAPAKAPVTSSNTPSAEKTPQPTAPAATSSTSTGMAGVTLPKAQQKGWAVQLWSLSNSERAKALVYELRDAGYEAFLIEIAAQGKTFYRVNAGPVTSKAQAQALLEKLKKDTTVQVDEGFPLQLSR